MGENNNSVHELAEHLWALRNIWLNAPEYLIHWLFWHKDEFGVGEHLTIMFFLFDTPIRRNGPFVAYIEIVQSRMRQFG